MSEYGQMINPDFDPNKDNVYKYFYTYFNEPIMTKIKDVEIYSVYMTKIHAMLGNSYRYLILFIAKDIEKNGSTKKMSDCEWISLQTRTLEDFHNIKSHVYNAHRASYLNQKIIIKDRGETQTSYDVESLPIIITLLHTRKNCSYQYNQTGTVVSALETYQTIVNFK